MNKPHEVNQGAGKGDSPRPVKGEIYRNNYDDIFRRKPASDEELFESDDFDSHDENTYNLKQSNS